MNLGHETETLEFKKTTGELKEGVVSIAAILNKHQKGELYFGIKPDGTPIGQQISEKTLRDISQEIANHIEPRIYPEIAVVHIDDKDCIHVSFEGHNTPYFAYNVARIRVADEDKVMSQQELTDYIMEQQSNEGVWERKVSECLTSSVDENSLKEYIHRGQEFGRISFDYSDRDTVLGKLSLTAGSYLLNAGMVLFGETPYNDLQMAVFAGTERLTFLDIQREHGTIFELVDRAEKYIFKNIRWRVEFGSLQRKEIPEIPVDAVREALINSFCHKEYGTGQNNEVSIYKDRVEIYNPGTFPAGYEPEDFISGRERPIRRNPLIAQTLYYSKNVESFGTGLKRIADACDAAGCKYKFEVLKSGFVVVFYRSDENFDTTGTDTTPVTIPVNTPDKDIRSKIVSLCLNAPQTREQLMQACGMKNKAHFLKAYLKPMLETGELQLTVPDKPNSRNQKYIAVRHTTGEVR